MDRTSKYLNVFLRWCIIYCIIGFIWQGLELLILGHLNPSTVDSIIDGLFSVVAYNAWMPLERKIRRTKSCFCKNGTFAITTIKDKVGEKVYAVSYYIMITFKDIHTKPYKEDGFEHGSWMRGWLFFYFGVLNSKDKDA
jgi:hypothetical protein